MRISECTNPILWNEFVRENGNIHHLYEWKYINEATFGCPCINLACWEEDRVTAIYPYIVRGRWPLRWYVSPNDFGGGPVGDKKAVAALVQEVHKRAKKQWISMNVVRYDSECNGLFKESGYEATERKNLVVDIRRPEEAIWNSLRDKVRNSVRKSTRQGIEVSEGSVDDLEEYLELSKKQREAIGYKGRSNIFIYALFNHLDTTLLLAKWKMQIVGGCVYIKFNGRVSGIHAARDLEKGTLRIGEALHWGAIKHFKSLGCTEYDFLSRNDNHVENGKTHVCSSLETLHRFKQGFKPEKVTNYDFTCNHSQTGKKLRTMIAGFRNRALQLKSKIKRSQHG